MIFMLCLENGLLCKQNGITSQINSVWRSWYNSRNFNRTALIFLKLFCQNYTFYPICGEIIFKIILPELIFLLPLWQNNFMTMKQFIAGREREKKILGELYKSSQSEFAVVYGRRRVGKTYLVREMFDGKMTFYHTALSPFDMAQDNTLLIKQQLQAFASSLRAYGDYHAETPQSWLQAFEWLRELLLRQPKRKRLVVFLDELPWMDTPRSGFVSAFEHFWNGWGAGQRNLFLIVCGSAASWINDRLLNNTGGLYGRATREIHLSPFTLVETEEYLRNKYISFERYDILQCYMAMGGIPYYLSYLEKGLSAAQNLDNLFFRKGSKLKTEFNRLFKSLFVNSEQYEQIVRLLATRREGFTRGEICKALNLKSGGGLSNILRALESSDFITQYIPYGESARATRYKLIDLFTLFYYHFVEKNTSTNKSFWSTNQSSPRVKAWSGFAFEEVCYVHTDQIKQKLGISGIHTEISPWRSKQADDHAQIDMLIDRADRVITLCEMKHSITEFAIDKSYDSVLRNKQNSFVEQTKCRNSIQVAIITTFGLKQNTYSGRIQNVVTLDDLFL